MKRYFRLINFLFFTLDYRSLVGFLGMTLLCHFLLFHTLLSAIDPKDLTVNPAEMYGRMPVAGQEGGGDSYKVVKGLNRNTENGDLSKLNEINKQKGKLIQIAVEAIEVKNNKARTLGIKWVDSLSVGEAGTVVEGRDPQTMPELPAIFQVGDFVRLNMIRADIKLAMDKGAARLLANPKLVVKTETNGDFLVGGEVPYAVWSNGGWTIEWKEYGVKLNVVPTIMEKEKDLIGLAVFVEVSDLDYANGIKMSDLTVPAIITRNTSSSVQMRSGETLTVAGLIREFKEQTTIGIPFLADIPFLGYLFSQQRITDNKTTVVIFITPTILKDTLPVETKP